MKNRSTLCWALGALLLVAPAAQATWSIIIIDTRTKEIAIGSATCLTNFDLRRGLPVVRVGIGAAAAQSAIDSSGANRLLIWNELAKGTDPSIILQLLEQQDGSGMHRRRQYGIVDVLGRAVTFTGDRDGPYANGLTGQIGDLVYSIQGNVITGQPVLDMAEAAILNTPGDIPEKLMAAMEAARSMGGDGRCSCDEFDADGCGSPPPSFEKSAHIGFMIVSRRGDHDGGCDSQIGCASGIYHMNFNVPFAKVSDPDPVIQLRDKFDTWRDNNRGRVDHLTSRKTFSPRYLPADGQSQTTLTVELLDWESVPINEDVVFRIAHDDDSAQASQIGSFTKHAMHLYTVPLTAGNTPGIDRIKITIDDQVSTKVLMPSAQIIVLGRGDMNGDGRFDAFDIDAFALALFDPTTYEAEFPELPYQWVGDMNEDDAFDAHDIDGFVNALMGL
ncbi:MAG: hypothetical protein CHACPFDD_00832 [Phycisphaerae bacterium]|nr:hypothetical protein [Phycisphaerae bacterium]